MARIIHFVIFLTIGIICSLGATVVPGRTWWYSSEYTDWKTMVRYPTHFGLRLADVQNYVEGSPLDCYVIDGNKNRIMDVPLAQLWEKDGQVWMRPTPKLYENDSAANADPHIIYFLQRYLGFWNGYKFFGWDIVSEWADVETDKEFLIYDWNFEKGDVYQWPWTGMNTDLVYTWDICEGEVIGDAQTRNYSEKLQKGFFIGETDEITLRNGEKARRYTLVQIFEDETVDTPSLKSPGYVIEGIGIVEGQWQFQFGYSYIPGLESNIGYWLCPVYSATEPLTGYDPSCPSLESVTEADGTCIYGDPEFEKKLAQIASPEASRPRSGQLHDLQGRLLSEPVRGQLYVRDGKLQFAK